MYVYENTTSELADWIRAEMALSGPVEVGMRGGDVRRVQEWLTLRGYSVAVDGIYGVATANAVVRFQEDSFLPDSGRVDAETFERLVEPMRETLRQRLNMSQPLGDAILAYAQAHLSQHPREIGGENRGPWVRLYMRGNEGREWLWCAGFVTFVLHQATESLQIEMPIPGSFSCDSLAAQAQARHLFITESEARSRVIPPGSLFLNRRTASDWTHVGIVVDTEELTFTTIEGNTNDDGAREGYEVCMRTRAYANRDFIVFNQ